MNNVSLQSPICFHFSSSKSDVNHLNKNYTDTRLRMKELGLDIDFGCPLLMKLAQLLFILCLNAIAILWIQ